MNKSRFDVRVVTLYPGGQFGAELAANNINVINLKKRGRWDIIGVLCRLVSELKTIRPDILHSYLVEPNLVAVLIKPLFRSTKIVWGVLSSKPDLTKCDWFVRLNFRLQALFSGCPDLIIFNSNKGRTDHLIHGFPKQRSLVIHSGVDVDKFRPNRQSGIPIRKGWNINDGTVLIGLVGRFDPQKDHETFVKAAAFLAAEVFDCCFVFIGYGPVDCENRLRQIVAQYNLSERVVWAGVCADMPAVYNALDIVCLSSISEGLPYAITEAMSCDIPCVATDVGDLALLVGDTGIVVPPRNPEALAAGLKKCIENYRAGVPTDPRQRILTDFNLQRLVERTEEALDSVTEN